MRPTLSAAFPVRNLRIQIGVADVKMASPVAKKEDKLSKSEKNDAKNGAEEKPKETTVEFLSSLAAVLVTGLFIITFVMQAFEIPPAKWRGVSERPGTG